MEEYSIHNQQYVYNWSANGELSEELPQIEDQKSYRTELVFIDTDPGIDDAYAIFMAFRAEKHDRKKYKVVGISTVCGNSNVSNSDTNVAQILNQIGESKFKINSGAGVPLIESKTIVEDTPYFGKDGFGDAGLPLISASKTNTYGPIAIVEALTKHKGKLTLLALGPLTNLAIAVKINPLIKSYPKRIIILGGTINGVGNVRINTEFNFGTDPEAARIVLESFTSPIIIVPWETCLKSFSTYAFRIETLGNLGTSEIEFLNKIEKKSLEKNKKNWSVSDAIVAAISIEPQVIKSSEERYYTVELAGEFTRGMGIADRIGYLKKKPNVQIVTEIDQKLYEKMLIWASGGPYYKDY